MASVRPIFVLGLLVGCSKSFVPKDSVELLDSNGTGDDSGTTPDSTPPDVATVAFTSPGDEATNPVSLAVTTTGEVARVAYFLDTLPLAESVDAAGGFATTWTADRLGDLTLTARAYDAAGIEVASAQEQTRVVDLGRENTLGVWLVSNETAGYSHEELAGLLAALGVKRVYIETGGIATSCDSYPEACDPSVPAAYHARGISAYGYSTPSPNNGGAGINAITYTSEAGYDGYVVVLTPEWDGEGTAMENMATLWRESVDDNISIGRAPSTYALDLSADADPAEAGLRIDVADPYFDAILPKVFVELLGQDAVDDPAGTLRDVVCEYVSVGATQPIYPILGNEQGLVGALGINDFFEVGGAQSSLWRVPDNGDAFGLWDTWAKVDWTNASLPDSAACE